MKRLVAVLLVLLGVAGAGFGRERIRAPGLGGPIPLLYLPNGRHLRLLSLGHASLVADWVYLWAIQFYSDYDRADRYRYVEHVFGDVISELDPHYVDPYWLGALILIVEAGDLEGGLRLLDKGFANNPGAWILPHLAGWECYRAGQLERAAAYLDRAARAPGAPAFILRMKAGMLAKAGDLREAVRNWEEVLRDPRGDDASREIAQRQLRGLEIRLDVDEIRSAIAAFRARTGRLPWRLEMLVSAGLLPSIPRDPDGNPYAYDRSTGEVGTVAGRILGGR